MKRIILAATALILAFALCACNGGGNSGTTAPTNLTQAPTSEFTQAPTSEPVQVQNGRRDNQNE